MTSENFSDNTISQESDPNQLGKKLWSPPQLTKCGDINTITGQVGSPIAAIIKSITITVTTAANNPFPTSDQDPGLF